MCGTQLSAHLRVSIREGYCKVTIGVLLGVPSSISLGGKLFRVVGLFLMSLCPSTVNSMVSLLRQLVSLNKNPDYGSYLLFRVLY